jgi:hypothetical protein
MYAFGMFEIIVLAVSVLVFVTPMWTIFRKAGFAGPLSLLLLVPGLNLIVLYYVAFARWPAHDGNNRAPSPYDPIHPS